MRIRKLYLQSKVNPQSIINTLKQVDYIKNAYQQKANDVRDWTLEEHTLIVMNEFEKYFAPVIKKFFNDDIYFRIVLALHDIGKPEAIKNGDKELQTEYTIRIFNKLRSKLDLSNKEVNLFIALIDGDTMGDYLRGKNSLEYTLRIIEEKAKKSDEALTTFFYLLTVYYQSDTSSYTKDALGRLLEKAGDKPLLDDIFVYNENNAKIFDNEFCLLKFSERINTLYQNLKNKIYSNEVNS